MSARILLHIDLNSYFASVEQLLQPALRNQPIAVAGNPNERRGIIITCSYEARAYGVKTTMHVRDALRLCPQLLIVPPNFRAYREHSQRFFALLREVTPLVEPVSIDEGYIDITDVAGEAPLQFVIALQQRILHELGLPCSIGVAPNKFLAKMASDMKKPLGITVLRKRDVPTMLWPKPVEDMHGVGKKTAKKLHALRIMTIGELAAANAWQLKAQLGVHGERLHARANGHDAREVDPLAIYDTKSVGNSTTLRENVTEQRVLYETVKQLSEKVSARLIAKQLAGTTVSIMIRTSDWQTYTRSKTVMNALYDAEAITQIAWALFQQHWQGEPVRLLGVTVSHVIAQQQRTEQLDLFNFEQHAKEEPLLAVMEKINDKFKKKMIIKANEIRVNTRNFHSNSSFSKDFLSGDED